VVMLPVRLLLALVSELNMARHRVLLGGLLLAVAEAAVPSHYKCPLKDITVPDAVAFCRRLVQAKAQGMKNNSLVLDVGAAGGMEAIVANRLGYSSLSFECRADEYALVSKKLAHLPNAKLLHACASDHGGYTTIYRAGHASSMHHSVVSATWMERTLARRERVKSEVSAVVTLDEVLADLGTSQGVGFLRMDVQGNEAQVFAGARRTLLEHRPFLMYEYQFDANVSGHVAQTLASNPVDYNARAQDVLFASVPGAESAYHCSCGKEGDCFCVPANSSNTGTASA